MCTVCLFNHSKGNEVEVLFHPGIAVAQWLRCCATNRFPMVSMEFSLTRSFRSHYGPEVYSVANRNEYHVNFLGVNSAGA